MNGTTQVEAGPSRAHGHIAIPSSSASTRRLSNSTQTQSQSRSSSNRRSSPSAPHETTSTSTSHPPTSSSSEANDHPHNNSSTQKSKSYHLDIANYPTQQLLRLLAGLLQHIATSNDALRTDTDHTEGDDEGEETLKDEPDQNHVNDNTTRSRSRSHSRTSSQPSFSQQHSSSPTTALFDSSHPTDRPATPDIPPSSGDDYPLFTASKSSLSHPSSLLAFHARHIPSISIEAYLLRILKYCPTTNEVFLGLLVYFDRMTRLGTPLGVGGPNVLYNHSSNGKQGRKSFAIDSYNVHRLVIAGVTVASKFFSDVFYTNSRYAKVGGLPPTELNSLELQFLLLNDFRLRISLDEMQKYGDRLLAYAEEQEEGLEVERERERMERSGLGEKEKIPSTSQQQQRNQNQDTSKVHDAPPSDQTVSGKETTTTEVDGHAQPQPQPQVSGNTVTGTASGIKDWVRGEEVMSGRMASPMRD